MSTMDVYELARATAHDLSEPLRTLRGFTGLLLRDDLDPEEKRQALQFIHDEADRMQVVVDDLMEYATVTTTSLNVEFVDVLAEVQQIIQALAPTIEAKRAKQPVRICVTGLPTSFPCDRSIGRAIYNLISNSLKFHALEGAIEILVDGSDTTDRQLVLKVTDNGIGIEQNDLDKIVLPFRRVHQRDNYPGTGLGLAIVSNVCRRHGGKLVIESSIGEGTTMTIIIPGRPNEKSAKGAAG